MIMRSYWLYPVQETPIHKVRQYRRRSSADLILVDGDVLKDITLLGDPERNFAMIMKGGTIYKNKI